MRPRSNIYSQPNSATIGTRSAWLISERNLAITRADNADHPQDQPSEVEDVMIITLENNHIALPDSFYDVNKNFRPKLPPKK